MLGGYTVIHLASRAAGTDRGGILYHRRYRGIAAGLEWLGIMLHGLLGLHILLGLLLPSLCRIFLFCILPAQKLRLLLRG